MAASERALRVELAATYRIFDYPGWTELIYNHITARVPGSRDQFLINPFGLHYREVTASNLVKIDIHGNKLDDSRHPVNPAGFLIHAAIHAHRPDVHVVMHTHTTAGMAVACSRPGLEVTNSLGGGAIPVSDAVAQKCTRDSLQFNPQFGAGRDVFDALRRLVDARDTTYKS